MGALRLGRHLSAFAATGLALLTGVWLLVSPWVLDYPRPASAWGAPTLIAFWTGAGVVAVSAVTLLLYAATLAAALRRLAGAAAARPAPAVVGSRAARRHRARSAAAAAPPRGVAAEDRADSEAAARPVANVDEVLVPLATALLADLVRRRSAAGGQGPSGEGR